MSKNNNTQHDLFSEVNMEISIFYNQLVRKMEDPQFPSEALKRKNLSQLSSKIYKLLNEKGGNVRQVQQNRDIFLKIVESHLTNFINNQIIINLIRTTEEYSFAEALAKGWMNYKRILFSFFTFFIHIKDYYETARIAEHHKSSNKNKGNQGNKQQETIGVNLFEAMVLRRFHHRLRNTIKSLLKREREVSEPSNNDLRILFEILWSCSLKELARIAISKQEIYFIKEERKEFACIFTEAANNEQFINKYILNEVCNEAASHYAELCVNMRQLNGIEQIELINERCELEEEIARFHLPSKVSTNTYLNAVYGELILFDFDHILKKFHGFKHIVSHFSHLSSELQKEITTYFKVIRRVESQAIEKVIRIIDDVIAERGGEIREKLNKPREFMIDMLHFKKSLRKIFAIVETNTLKIEVAMEKGFKSLMDGFEVSKSLAEFADFTIRECIRLKLDESSCEEKLKEVMFMLTSVSAKDLFLAYHQDAMAKRMLDCLNEPKLEPQLLFLKLLADNLGNIMMLQHFSMIKDIQNSVEITDNIGKILPFISYKWDLRVINSGAWPDSALKIRFSDIQPPQLLRGHLFQLQDLYKQYRGFNLQWKLDRGTSLFEGRFLKGKWRFQAENIYLIILLHLNEQPYFAMTFAKLSELINNQKKEGEFNYLQNYVKVLIENRLIRRGNPKELSAGIELDEVLEVNKEYTPSEQVKTGQTIFIKMSQQLAKTLNQSNVEINKVLKDRQRLVDALLVKFLKHAHSTGSNRITFMQLYDGIKSNPYLSNFNFTQTVVKQRLQQLISKQYCLRDEQDRRVYHYIA